MLQIFALSFTHKHNTRNSFSFIFWEMPWKKSHILSAREGSQEKKPDDSRCCGSAAKKLMVHHQKNALPLEQLQTDEKCPFAHPCPFFPPGKFLPNCKRNISCLCLCMSQNILLTFMKVCLNDSKVVPPPILGSCRAGCPKQVPPVCFRCSCEFVPVGLFPGLGRVTSRLANPAVVGSTKGGKCFHVQCSQFGDR